MVGIPLRRCHGLIRPPATKRAKKRALTCSYTACNKGSGCVLDTRVTDTDARSYSQLSFAQVLKAADKVNKDKHLAPCLARRRGFMPLVYSVGGMAGKEAKSFERCIASLLAVKWDCPYSEMVGYVRGRMWLAIIRHNTTLLRGFRSK